MNNLQAEDHAARAIRPGQTHGQTHVQTDRDRQNETDKEVRPPRGRLSLLTHWRGFLYRISAVFFPSFPAQLKSKCTAVFAATDSVSAGVCTHMVFQFLPTKTPLRRPGASFLLPPVIRNNYMAKGRSSPALSSAQTRFALAARPKLTDRQRTRAVLISFKARL